MDNKLSNNKAPVLGAEYPQENEPAIVDEMIREMKGQLEDLYQKTKTLRQVHSKMHGCLKAEFTVEKDLPEEYRVGIFKEAKSYQAWLRLSNGKTKVLHDKKKDTRGFAIKIMGVPGKKLLAAEEDATTQDFVLANSPVFFAKNLQEFHGLMTASIQKSKLALPIYLLSNMKIAIRTLTKLLVSCKHALGTTYFSSSPYRFGAENKAVKYVIKPSEHNVLEYTSDKDFNYLRKSMLATLAKNEINYDFFIQFQMDPVKMPIEDGTIEWTSPLIKVASIRIPKQNFDTPEWNEFGENLTYNVWHTLPEHRPLGSFNRGRRKMYEELYKFRHDRNHVTQPEPVAKADFFTNINSL